MHGTTNIKLSDVSFATCYQSSSLISMSEILQECSLESQSVSDANLVKPYCAVVGKTKELINIGDFVKFATQSDNVS